MDKIGAINPWDIRESEFPKFGTRGEKLEFLLRYAVLAYSPLNTQPWQFRIKHDTVEIHLDLSRQLKVRDPDCRQVLLSCGCALGNLIVACRYFGYEPNLNLLKGKLNSTLVATVALGALVEPTTEITHWLENMTELELGLSPFRQGPLPATLVQVIARVAKQYSVRVKNIENQEKALLKVCEVACEREGGDPHFQAEFSDWLRAQNHSVGDGLPTGFFGIGGLGALLGRRSLTHLKTPKGLAKAYRQVFTSASGGFIINTEGDAPDQILEAGIVLQQSLLAIRSQGLLGVVVQPPIDIDPIRKDLGRRFLEERSPQAFVVFGWAKKQGVKLPKREFESFFSLATLE